ncbi:MAG: OsmC family protein [Gammaproteobacteria bacterium]
MSEYSAIVTWARAAEEPYLDNNYGRLHEWRFDGGTTVPASASPHIVPLPYSVASAVDPEEAFVAAPSSCHMLFFFSIAAQKRFIVDRYVDNAIGFLEKDGGGRDAMTRVILRREIAFSGDKRPSVADVEHIHHRSHELCFIANSVRTLIDVEIPSATRAALGNPIA